MESTLKGLKAAYDRSAEYVNYLRDQGLLANESEVSDFWAQIFNDPSRTNYPDFNSVLAMRRGATYPLADAAAVDDATEREAALAAHMVISRTVPAEFLRSFPESVVGCPRCIEIDGSVLSAGGTINALTTYRLLKWLSRRSVEGKPIRVLEIGAGYGQVAYQLCTLANVESYTIIDLPENLFLSSFYLQANFPDWKTDFVRAGSRLGSLPAETFRFLVPPLVDALEGEYDLILNSYSFQEMNLASVQRYFRLAAERLAPGGIFYSLNAHGKSGIGKPSDYDTERFEWLGFTPVRRFPHHSVFATTPYEIVFGRREEGGAIRRELRHFDALAATLQLGVFDDLVPYCDAFVAGTLTGEQRSWLDAASRFFEQSDAASKRTELSRLRETGVLPEVVQLMAGFVEFALGDFRASTSMLEPLLSHFAGSYVEARISLLLAGGTAIAADRERWMARVNGLIPYLRAEARTLVANPPTLKWEVGQELRLTIPDSRMARIKKLLKGADRATTV